MIRQKDFTAPEHRGALRSAQLPPGDCVVSISLTIQYGYSPAAPGCSRTNARLTPQIKDLVALELYYFTSASTKQWTVKTVAAATLRWTSLSISCTRQWCLILHIRRVETSKVTVLKH